MQELLIGRRIIVKATGECYEVIKFVPREYSDVDQRCGHYDCINVLNNSKAVVSQLDLQRHIRRNVWKVIN